MNREGPVDSGSEVSAKIMLEMVNGLLEKQRVALVEKRTEQIILRTQILMIFQKLMERESLSLESLVMIRDFAAKDMGVDFNKVGR